MSTNGETTDQGITAEEYERVVAAQEEEANLVLGGDDGKECTYAKGYVTRQAVFACVTCTPQGGAGFCLACSINCHDGHEVLEIYTKRGFRCDCGNSKFPGLACKLAPDKDPINERNLYNQNFTGLYCTCHRPYPDPERDEEGETMFQCVVCEDWLHEDHLGLRDEEEVPNENDEASFDELVCQACANTRCPFLTAHPELQLEPILTTPELPSRSPSDSSKTAGVTSPQPTEGGGTVEKVVELGPNDASILSASNTRLGLPESQLDGQDLPGSQLNGQKLPDSQSNGSNLPAAAAALVAQLARIQTPASISFPASNSSFGWPHAASGGSSSGANGPPDPQGDPSRRTSFAAFNALLRGDESRSGQHLAESGHRNPGSSKPRGEKRKEPASDTCPRTPQPGQKPIQRAVFLIRDWRQKLCRCAACVRVYEANRVTFLLEPRDTVAAYEEEARARGEENRSLSDTAEESLDGFLRSMPRVQQVEVIQGYHDMAAGLREYLAPFARSGATVTEENIRGFFDQLRSKRRRFD